MIQEGIFVLKKTLLPQKFKFFNTVINKEISEYQPQLKSWKKVFSLSEQYSYSWLLVNRNFSQIGVFFDLVVAPKGLVIGPWGKSPPPPPQGLEIEEKLL